MEKKIPPEKDQCVLPHCVYIFNLFTPTLQLLSLSCFYEMLKKWKRIISSYWYFFVRQHCVVFVLLLRSILFYLCSVRELSSSK